jgi:DNA-binding phage protein
MANQKKGVVRQCDCDVCRDHPRSAEAREHLRINRMLSTLDEKNARRVAGLLASRVGHGGTSLISRITGMSRQTIDRGLGELEAEDEVPVDRVRAVGGGRKPLEKKAES